jgi:hypothetical protein
MDLLSLGLLLIIVYYIVHDAYIYVIGFIGLSLMAQMFSKDRLWFLLVPILVIHMLYMFVHDEYEGFRRRRRRRGRGIRRRGRGIRRRGRGIRRRGRKRKKKTPRCVTKTVNHCKALKKTACRHATKMKKMKKIRGPEWMWKKKYMEELGRHKNTKGQNNNCNQLNKNYRERLGKAKNTSGSWLVS